MRKSKMLLLGVGLLASACAAEDPQPVAPVSEPPPVAATPLVAPAPATPQMVTVTSKSPEAVELFKAGRDLGENSRVGEATEAFKKALQADPDFALAHAYLGAFDQSPEGARHVDQASSLSKALPEAERLFIESVAAAKRGEQDKAFEIEKQLARLVPNDWRTHLWLGGDLVGRRQWEPSIAELKKSVELNPNAGPSFNLLGYAYSLQGKLDDAIAAFQRYAAVAPTQPNAHDSLADAYLMAGRFDEAEASYRKAVAVNPVFFFSWQGVAVTRFVRGDFGAGYEALAKAKASALRPVDKVDMEQAVAWGQLVEGRTADALKSFEAVEKSAGDQKLAVQQGFAGDNRAFTLVNANKPLDAVKQIDATLERADKAGLSGDDLTQVKRWGLSIKVLAQAKLGKGPDAQKTSAAIDELALKEPTNPNVQSVGHFAKGMAIWAGGDAKAAVAELSQCQSDDSVCRWQLALAQEKAGDKPGADATRTKFTATPRRDMLNVFTRLKLTGKPPAPKAK